MNVKPKVENLLSRKRRNIRKTKRWVKDSKDIHGKGGMLWKGRRK